MTWISLSKLKIVPVYTMQGSCVFPVPATGHMYEKVLLPGLKKILIVPCHKICTFLALIQLSAHTVCGLGDASEDTIFYVRAGGPERRKAALLLILILISTAVAVEVAIAQRCWASQRQQGVLQSGSRQKVSKYFPSKRVKLYTQGPKRIWGKKCRGEYISDMSHSIVT